jgi:CRP/FNR family transcriptional regulator
MRKDIHNSDVPVLCIACEARHKGICGALSADELMQLSRHTQKTRHSPGAEIIGEAEETNSYANVMRGVVKLSKVLEDGRQQVVGLQFAPDFLGRPFTAQSAVSAEAASNVETCSFPRSTLEALIASNPKLEHRLLEQSLRELDEARDWMMTLGRRSASEKVASFLMLIACHIDPTLDEHPQSTTFELPLSRMDIADFLGLTIETVSRQLTRLRKGGVIEIVHNRTVTVPDIKRLSDLCG